MDQEVKPLYPDLAEEIIKMSDQEKEVIVEKQGSEKWEEVTTSNTKRLKELIEKMGWPTISKVGREGSRRAFLIAQHATHDLEFQKNVLGLMKEQPETEVLPRNIAYLEDRIATKEGRPQRYGTQLPTKGGVYVFPDDVEDPENLDERRARVGLKPMADYIKQTAEFYGVGYKLPEKN